MIDVNWELIDKLGIKRDALTERVALITGGARGIGECTARTMAALGARVVIVDVLPEGQNVVDAIRDRGGQAAFIPCDISVVEDLNAMIPKAEAAFGPVDVLINNALYVNSTPLVALRLEDWDRTFHTNARAPFILMKHFLPGMLARKQGTMVNMIAYEGSPLAAAYAGTKVALRSMALTAAREIGNQSGVSIFSFVPGIVDTPLIHDVLVPQATAILGITTEQMLANIAQNPGYSGLIPVDHCASALVHSIVHAPEYHGQVADPFEPLDRVGVIQIPQLTPKDAPAQLDMSGPGVYIKQYLGNITALNQDLEQRIEIRTRELEEARRRSEELLLNILPEPIAERLKHGEKMIADHFSDVTVLFADIVNFTPMSAHLDPQRVVKLLDIIFSAFDRISGRYELEKIKTIGDCYMAVGGLPEPKANHAELVANAALDMLPTVDAISKEVNLPLKVRIGLHSGNVVAGVIGQQKFIYDLWGDTVNTASRMESHGVENRIHVTEQVYHLLENRYRFEPRGAVDIKGKGRMSTYFLVDGHLDQNQRPEAGPMHLS